jgi:hypothetical protein
MNPQGKFFVKLVSEGDYRKSKTPPCPCKERRDKDWAPSFMLSL